MRTKIRDLETRSTPPPQLYLTKESGYMEFSDGERLSWRFLQGRREDPRLAPRDGQGFRSLEERHWNALFATSSFEMKFGPMSNVMVSGRPVLLFQVVDTIRTNTFFKWRTWLVSFEETRSVVSDGDLVIVLKTDYTYLEKFPDTV